MHAMTTVHRGHFRWTMSQNHVHYQMIDHPLPDDWKELQSGVKRLLRNIGLDAETEVEVETPRGKVELDVFAVDVRSVDKIRYVVECKNWNASIPQTVVHAFTTVMHETGSNIGFIVSKHGLQSGAEQYTRNTNIIGLTYLELQQRYFKVWWERYFCPRVGDAADRVMEYVEPFSPIRTERCNSLDPKSLKEFERLQAIYSLPVNMFSMFNVRTISPNMGTNEFTAAPLDLDSYLRETLIKISPHVIWRCATFRELLDGILNFLRDAETAFNALFGGHIYERDPITNVGPDGPALD
jgi:hypothetical protein